MHMADMLISPTVGAAMYVASLGAASIACRKIQQVDDDRKIPFMGVVGAFIFAAQMINFSIPGTGSSGHLCGGLLAAALLGPYEGFMVMIAILAVQSLLFADGGLLALGCNIWNMGFYACLFSWFCIFKPILGNKITKRKIFIASVISSIVSLQLGAGSVVIETLLSDVTELTPGLFLAAMQSIHLAIGIIEGLVTATILCFVWETRPEILAGAKTPFNLKPVILTFAVTALITSGGLSLLASENPDGLEWSIAKVGLPEASAPTFFASLQEITAIFPDYNLAGSDSFFISSLAGILGTVFIVIIISVTGLLFRHWRKKAKSSNEQSI